MIQFKNNNYVANCIEYKLKERDYDMNEKIDNTAFFKLSYGLYLLSAKDEAKDNGCIINTTVQVTNTPLKISVTVNKANYTHDMILKTGLFNVSVLSEEAPFEIFKHYGFQSGREVDKIIDTPQLTRSENGLFYLPACTNAFISGKVTETIDLGTHTLFIADVTEAKQLSNANSVTYDYYHKNIKPKPENDSSKKGYRCKICGYVYDKDELPEDFICPICKHGASDIEKI